MIKNVHINVCLILSKVRINEKIWNQMTTTIPDKFKIKIFYLHHIGFNLLSPVLKVGF